MAAVAAIGAASAYAPLGQASLGEGGEPRRSAGGTRLVQRAEARITVAPTIVAEPASQVAFAIQIGPSSSLPANSFVRIRGLPPSVSLSEGHSIGPGSWAVPLFSLSGLKANVPSGVSGRSEVIVSLVGVDGLLLDEAKTALIVGPSAMLAPAERSMPEAKRASPLTPPAPVPAGRPDRNAQAARPPLSGEEKAAAEKLLTQGERYLEQGNVAIARQFFQRAADAGLAAAAIRLAATYDPAELVRLNAQGVVPDRAEARKWYERAKELGAPEAEERLARLGAS